MFQQPELMRFADTPPDLLVANHGNAPGDVPAVTRHHLFGATFGTERVHPTQRVGYLTTDFSAAVTSPAVLAGVLTSPLALGVQGDLKMHGVSGATSWRSNLTWY
jgi:hypothetical protein